MFPKKNRLSKKSDVLLVLKRGRKFTRGICNIYFLEGDLEKEPRVTVVVSKKVSTSSVARNRVKRIFREILRPRIGGLRKGLNIVVVAKKEILGRERDFIERALGDFLKYV